MLPRGADGTASPPRDPRPGSWVAAAGVSWLPDRRSPRPSRRYRPWPCWGSLPGDSGGTAPDSHRLPPLTVARLSDSNGLAAASSLERPAHRPLASRIFIRLRLRLWSVRRAARYPRNLSVVPSASWHDRADSSRPAIRWYAGSPVTVLSTAMAFWY